MQINGGNGGCGVQLVGNISWNVFINGTGWLTIECKDASGMKWHFECYKKSMVFTRRCVNKHRTHKIKQENFYLLQYCPYNWRASFSRYVI
jgi:hypothetical protein